MNVAGYLKSVWRMEDKFRIVAIVALAVAVLGLSVFESTEHASEYREHGESHMHMH